MKNDSFIHRTAEVSPQSKIGLETKVWHQAQVMNNVVIGNMCVIGKGVFIGNRTHIGDFVKIQNYANIFGGQIEDAVLIGPMVTIVNDRFPRATNNKGQLKSHTEYTSKFAKICLGSSLGASAVIMPGVVVGRYAMVAAGSIVYKDVADHALVMGNPARQLGYVCCCGHTLSDGLTCDACNLRYKLDNHGINRVP